MISVTSGVLFYLIFFGNETKVIVLEVKSVSKLYNKLQAIVSYLHVTVDDIPIQIISNVDRDERLPSQNLQSL